MAFGTFDVIIDGEQIGGLPETAARLTVKANTGTLKDASGDKFKFPRPPASVTLPYTLTLDTDVAAGAGVNSETIGYTVLVTTSSGGSVNTTFAARPAGDVIALTDLTESVVIPVNDTIAARDSALAAATTAAASATSAAASAAAAQTIVLADVGDAIELAVAAKADVADTLTIQRIDRQAISKARLKGASASIAYADATELTKDWTDLTGWQSLAVQVSGNRLYPTGVNNPNGALKSFSVAAGETAHISTVLRFKAGGANPQATYFGIDTGAADHGFVTNSPDGIFIGWNSVGVRAFYAGATSGGAGQTLDVSTIGPEPSGDADYLASVEVGVRYITFSLTSISSPSTSMYTGRVDRNTLTAAGKAINNIAVYIQDARGTGGHSFGPIVAVKSLQPARTKTLGGQTVEGVAPRTIYDISTTGDAYRISLPKTYDARQPAPVVLYAHQSLTGSQNTPWNETRTQPLTQALSDAGFIVAAANDGGDRWGNQASLDNYKALYEWVRDRFNTGPLFMIGASMGMLPVLNSISHRALPTPAAVVSIGGVCNLDDLWANATYDDNIATAYGISGPDAPEAEYQTKTTGFNPVDAAGSAFRGVPMRFYTSTGDTIVPKGTGCDILAAKVLPYTTEATVSVKSGGHLDPSQYPPAEIVSFFQTYL